MVISRSGINTICALLLLKKKSILIPLPIGQKNEQLQNAKLLESAGYGMILEQKNLTSEKLLSSIKKYLLVKMKKEKQQVLFYPNGAQNLVVQVMQCILNQKEK